MWVGWLHRLSKVYDPALLLMPQDVVLTQVSMHQVAPVEHLHHGLGPNTNTNRFMSLKTIFILQCIEVSRLNSLLINVGGDSLDKIKVEATCSRILSV